MSRLLIVPIGELGFDILNSLAQSLKSDFKKAVIVEMPEPEPSYAYDIKRKQYSSSMILRRLKSESSAGDIVLGVTSVDLFVPELTFVFGEAEISGRVALISIARLRPEFYGLGLDNQLLNERALKEAVHELGHVLGLNHCQNNECVMYFSNSINDTDRKSGSYCELCDQLVKV